MPPMTPKELEQYLYDHIPLSQAMAVRVEENSDRVVLSAPLEPNINHRQSVFGGSECSLALLAGWAWVRERVTPLYPDANLVIAQCQMNFLKPVLGEFTATCEGQDEQKLLDHLHRKGRARLTLTIQLHCEGILVGEMVGEFAAVLKR